MGIESSRTSTRNKVLSGGSIHRQTRAVALGIFHLISERLAEFSAVPTGLYLLFIVGAVKPEDLAVTLTEELSRLAKHGIEKVKQASHYAQAHLLTRWQEAMNIAMG